MSFIEGVLEQNKLLWDKCIATMFVQDMKDGRLPIEDFKEYMVQDSIYLKNYARVYGKAIYHAETLREIQLYYSILDFVTDTESAVRLNYLRQFGMVDDDIELIAPLPENQNYIDFLFEIAEGGNGCEILMAVLPCMLSYSYIFRKLAEEPESLKSRYWDFISDYADDRYADSCKEWCDFADKKCGSLSEAEQKKLESIFERAGYLELDFWNMAYQRKKA
ncbi:transcriptional regulator [Sporofaciens musculi]|uniref:transcriptional regulator n=1 Tax=Sporofaciens musculi TaxID=2681861 RepID=UPI00259CCC09|nr:transcriptional regulator [Sporofaciens musculi]